MGKKLIHIFLLTLRRLFHFHLCHPPPFHLATICPPFILFSPFPNPPTATRVFLAWLLLIAATGPREKKKSWNFPSSSFEVRFMPPEWVFRGWLEATEIHIFLLFVVVLLFVCRLQSTPHFNHFPNLNEDEDSAFPAFFFLLALSPSNPYIVVPLKVDDICCCFIPSHPVSSAPLPFTNPSQPHQSHSPVTRSGPRN